MDTHVQQTGTEYDAEALIKAAKRLRELGRPRSELPLLLRAAEIDGSARVLKTAFEAAIRDKNFDKGEDLLARLEQALGSSAKDRAWLDKARRQVVNRRLSFARLKRMLSVDNPPAYDVERGRICYVLHNALPFSSGGYATRAQGLACGMRNAGLDPVCITRPGFPFDVAGMNAPETQSMEPSVREVEGIPYHMLPKPNRLQVKGQAYLEMAARVLKSKFVELRPEVVMAASNFLTAVPAGIAARELGIPYIYEIRGLWEITRISREPEWRETPNYAEMVEFETLAAKSADHVFTLTDALRDEMIGRGLDGSSISLLRNSCDPTRFKPRPRDRKRAAELGISDDVPVIGYIGSFVQYEGLENLAQACAILARKGRDFRLLLVGNENVSGTDRGPITAEIMRVAKEEGLAEKLIMPGRVPFQEVESWYSLIDIAPFPRKPQPVTEMVSPMKPLEAFAMEKAVVASSVRALTDMVHHEKTGLIHEKGNVQALADTLERLIADPELRRTLGKAGRKWVEEERTWDKTAIGVASAVASFRKPLSGVGS